MPESSAPATVEERNQRADQSLEPVRHALSEYTRAWAFVDRMHQTELEELRLIRAAVAVRRLG